MVHIDLFQLIQVKVDVCFTQESMRGKSNEGVFVVVSVVCLFVSGLKTACLPEQMLSLRKTLEKPLAGTVRNFFVKLLPALPPSRSTDRFLLLQPVRIQLSKSLTLYSCPPKTLSPHPLSSLFPSPSAGDRGRWKGEPNYLICGIFTDLRGNDPLLLQII